MKFQSSDQTISWIRDRYTEGTLVLKPPFQRNPVWAGKQKSFLIESILLNLPVPEIYVQTTVDENEKTQYAVVDGQQRTRAVLQYIGVDQDETEAEHNQFSLQHLPATSPFKDKGFGDLAPAERTAFLKYRFSVRELDTDDDDVVRDMFRRLNKYLTKLNDQELRNATFSGPFMAAALDLAENPYWTDNRLVTPAQVRRMKDIEFVSELLIGVMHGPQAGSAGAIDEYYAQYEDFDDEFPGQRTVVKRFRKTLQLIKRALPDTENTRWRNRTDFYSLFVAVAVLLLEYDLPANKTATLRKRLQEFARRVDLRLADEGVAVPQYIVTYVRAVEKGANDKKRRADRHDALLQVVRPEFR